MDEQKIKRINELYRKSKSEGLTSEERKEQKLLREEYLENIRGNLRSQLNHIDIKEKDGVDYLRLTIFGQNEDLFKLLIENDVRREISDDEFFPTLTSFYIERGVAEMYSEYRYVNDRNKFLLKLIELSEK